MPDNPDAPHGRPSSPYGAGPQHGFGSPGAPGAVPPSNPYAPRPPFPPNAARSASAGTTTLVLGILSLVFMGPIGFVLGLIAISKASQVRQDAARGLIDPAAAENARIGRLCGIIGVSIGSIALVFMCLWFTCVGSAIFGGAMQGIRPAGQGGQGTAPAARP